ncbi:nucleotidyltransferase family protein [Paraliomyxa miuraensis]|uniref:nucleotidyltransferase family protein n=1 Tax=Paraliomyxa miuraensis TaxID=376150 RepID=UPI002257A945|nr:NTP transferase domain-containing protein [Paraliomyxa miuraensis]MCX4241478.1 NTP transferase domain-containing protein [Paraliomyxa miuraensis]
MSGLAAVVLAAGASTRMGRPKALLRWRGRPFVWHVCQQARAAGAGLVVVVEGAVVLPRGELGEGAVVVRNDRWADGPLGSLQTGLRALDEAGVKTPVLVLTVDRPHLREQTLRALAKAVAAEPDAIWQPRLGERRGHPIVYPADVVPMLVRLRPPQTPRTLLAQHDVAARRKQIEVDDPAVLDNLDAPEDLERLPP